MNKKQKERYLNTLSHPEKQLTALLFQQCERYEELFKKDLSEFSIAEIDKMYLTIKPRSTNTFITCNNRLNKYCMFIGATDNNYQYFANRESMSPYGNDSMLTKERMLKASKNLINPGEQFLFLAPFYGFTSDFRFEEMINLREKDIVDNHTIVMPDERKLIIPRRFADICRAAINTYEYHREDGVTQEMLGDGPVKYITILGRTPRNEDPNYYQLILARYRNIRHVLGKRFTYNFIRNSGIADRTNAIVIDHNLNSYQAVWDDELFQETVAKPFKLTTLEQFYGRYKSYNILF